MTIAERFAVATKPNQKRRGKQNERASLPNSISLSVGMQVMVTFNVETDLDIANGARGMLTKIILNEREPPFSPSDSIVELTCPPYVLVK